ncbi:unnamed protein product [Lota lota]
MALVPAASIDHGYSIIPTTEEPGVEEVNKGAKAGNDDPPVDWFEPLEEDDDTHSWEPGQHVHKRDEEEEEEEGSVAAESEKSGSVASDEKVFKRIYRIAHSRKTTNADEGWVDWPILGEGWKRRQVIRRSGSSVGQRDVYYVGPGGERVRSKVELAAVLGSVMNIAMFDFKTGLFHEGQPPRRKRRKIREHQSSESSYMEKDEGADTPDPCPVVSPQLRIKKEPGIKEDPTPPVKHNSWSPKSTLTCSGCGVQFIGTAYDRQRKKPCCPSCWSAKRKTHPSVRTKRWMPCGQCQACLRTSNCGSCFNCKDKLNTLPNSFSRLTCQKRRCLCPIRKVGSQRCNRRLHLHLSITGGSPSCRTNDTEHSVNIGLDDEEDDMSDEEGDDYDEDDEDWPKKRRRRACGTCDACLSTTDCGTCDFCVDKPKFGGRNTKRQKCRLRQCRRQAKRHLLPLQLGPGRRKPLYTYSRKPLTKRSKELPSGGHGGHDEDDSCSTAHISTSRGVSLGSVLVSNMHTSGGGRATAERGGTPTRFEDNDTPAITQIFSLAESQARRNVDTSSPLYKLLEELRATALPILWYAILVEGPRLQIIQCAKQSRMADTAVLIEPDFCYRVTVQKQPLLPCHPLYDQHPLHMSSVSQVVKLLLDLESYFMCQGIAMEQMPACDGPIILDRALTCHFLVAGTVAVCAACRALCGSS